MVSEDNIRCLVICSHNSRNLAHDRLEFGRTGSTGHNPAMGGAIGGEREIQGFPGQLSLELNTQNQTKSHGDVAILHWEGPADPHLQGHLVELGHGENGFLHHIHVFIPQEHVEVGNQF